MSNLDENLSGLEITEFKLKNGDVFKLSIISEKFLNTEKNKYAYVSEDKTRFIDYFYSGGLTGVGVGSFGGIQFFNDSKSLSTYIFVKFI